jgi:hypothetical protein
MSPVAAVSVEEDEEAAVVLSVLVEEAAVVLSALVEEADVVLSSLVEEAAVVLSVLVEEAAAVLAEEVLEDSPQAARVAAIATARAIPVTFLSNFIFPPIRVLRKPNTLFPSFFIVLPGEIPRKTAPCHASENRL